MLIFNPYCVFIYSNDLLKTEVRKIHLLEVHPLRQYKMCQPSPKFALKIREWSGWEDQPLLEFHVHSFPSQNLSEDAPGKQPTMDQQF